MLALGGWQETCAVCHGDLGKAVQEVLARDRNAFRPNRNSFEPLEPILKLDRPMDVLYAALDLQRQELDDHARIFPVPTVEQAIKWRDHLYVQMITAFPLRASHWTTITYDPNGSGHLRFTPHDGWQLVIPYSEFKNSSNTSIFPTDRGHHAVTTTFRGDPLFEDLIALVELYLSTYWPLLLDGPGPLFPAWQVLSEAITQASRPAQQDPQPAAFDPTRRMEEWSRRYIIRGSTGLGMRDVHSFGPHAIRDIVATHIIKVPFGSPQAAADALLDSVDITTKRYARFLPEDRGRRSRLLMTRSNS